MQGGFFISHLCYPHSLDTPTNGGRGERRSPVFVRPHGMYKFKPHNSPKRDVEGAVPYNYALLCHAAKSLSLFADFTSYKRTQKSGAEFSLRHHFVLSFSLFFFYCLSAPLVGLRLLRLCPFLVSEVEQEIYSAMGFAP